MDYLRRLKHRIVSNVCYWICEYLDGKTGRRTTVTKMIAGEALAVVESLDLERALAETGLPNQIYLTLGTFTPAEWQEVMAIADFNRRMIELELQRPQWAHLQCGG